MAFGLITTLVCVADLLHTVFRNEPNQKYAIDFKEISFDDVACFVFRILNFVYILTIIDGIYYLIISGINLLNKSIVNKIL
jgi:hypothetical protein